MGVSVIIGGTGTLGNALTTLLLRKTDDRIRIIARGEHRMAEMRRRFVAYGSRVSFIIGDVREEDRIRRALRGANDVYHCAALKHVHSCEYNVLEAVRTNIEGSANVVRAAIDAEVQRCVLVSSDKAVEPTTGYGATKMVAEKVFLNGNYYTGGAPPIFSVVRYGNVLASQGSVLTLWEEQRQDGVLSISDPSVTRFWWTVDKAARFVYGALRRARGGDIFVPLMAACSLGDLATLVAPECEWRQTSLYETEKLHEVLLARHETAAATYVNGVDAVRVSTLELPPADERPWGTNQLCSADYCDVAEVKRCLSAV